MDRSPRFVSLVAVFVPPPVLIFIGQFLPTSVERHRHFVLLFGYSWLWILWALLVWGAVSAYRNRRPEAADRAADET